MAGRGSFGSILVSAGLGAMATMAGLYLVKKVKTCFTPKPKMKLFHKHLCMSTRCAWLIAELGAEADFDIIDESPVPTESDYTGELLMLPDSSSLSDNKKKGTFPVVPYLKDNGYHRLDSDSEEEPDYPHSDSQHVLPAVVVNDEFTMIEGAAICMYLADLYGQFLPGPEHKAEYYSWIVYSAATFDNIIKTLHRQLVDCPECRRDEELVESATQGFHAFARALTESLANREYLCGKRFTAADCVVGFTLWWAYTIDHGYLLTDHPVLQTYLERLRERPAFQKTFSTDPEQWDWSNYFASYVRGIQGT